MDNNTLVIEPEKHGFTKEAVVITAKGKRSIQDVQRGDFVLTHKNRFKKVYKTSKDINTTTVHTIRAVGLEPLQTTAGQMFLTKKSIVDSPAWVEARNIETDWYIGVPDKVDFELVDPKAYIDQMIWIKVKYSKGSDKNHSTTYTLSVEDDESFIVNCYPAFTEDTWKK
jgi:hypothetical protein